MRGVALHTVAMRGRELPDEEGDHIELAKFIRARRAELGLGRREAARKAGIAEATFRTIEIGRPEDDGSIYFSAPTIDTLNRIALSLNIDAGKLRKVAGDHIRTDTRPGALDASGLTAEQIGELKRMITRYRRENKKR
ncbi:helix-turn-helix domain-containing protein [Rhodococcus qingshengii]|uniref:helix-turn-helix domain-containing protein n=1 Tax=Rhodococcus qingshengii TaxID=334542 RepID=UPI0037CA4500